MGRLVLVAAAAVLACASCGLTGISLVVLEGNYRLARGDSTDAVTAYVSAIEGAESRGLGSLQRIVYNLANAYNTMGETAAARSVFDSLQSVADAELLYRKSFNLGCIEYEMGRYVAAANSFVRALKAKPGDREAAANLELSLRKQQLLGEVNDAGPNVRQVGGVGPADTAIRVLQYIHSKEKTVWGSLRRDDQSESASDW